MNNRVSDLIHLMSHAKTISRQGFDDILGNIVDGLNVSGWELGPHVLNFDTDVLAFTADGRAADLCQLDKFGSAALSFKANKLSEFRNWFLSRMPTCCYRDEIEALILLDQGH